MPGPVPLDPPPGDPDALDDLVRQVSGAVFCLGVLETSLSGPAGSAPGWVGDDATAAAAQVDAVTLLARGSADALRTAAGRIALHRDRLREARSRVAALAAQQDDDHAAAWARLAGMGDPAAAWRVGDPGVTAVIDDLTAAESARRRAHAALLEEVAADATATAQVLAECSAVVGGTGRRGDAGRAVAHLAVALPAWGARELATRGAALADGLDGFISPDERDELARKATAYADLPAFADALLAGLGPDGVRGLLTDLGGGALPWHSALAALLASALGAARATGHPVDPVGDVLEAEYLDPQDPGSHVDVVALGMGAVIAAGLAGRSTGPAPQTVLSWGRQLLAREDAQSGHLHGGRAIDRANVVSEVMDAVDPVAVVAERLAGTADPAVAAALLGDRPAWDRLLARPWDDGAAALGDLIEQAGQDDGPAGQAAVRAGLTALGAGLEDNQPDGWTVDRVTAAAVAPALGPAVAAHVAVAVDALWIGVDDRSGPARADALRGLGLVTLDAGAAAALGEALLDWARAEIVAGAVVAPAEPAPVVAVPSAYLAARQWAVEMDHALDGFEAQADAERRALGWDLLAGWTGYLPGVVGDVAGVVEGYAAIALGMDGTWENGTDPGQVFDSGSAVDAGRAELGPLPAAAADEVGRQARIAFDRTTAVLGSPAPPESPPVDLLGPVLDAVTPGHDDVRGPGRRVSSRGTG
jgi:hypothetical protein